MVRKVKVVSSGGNEIALRSYADDDPDMSIQVEYFTRVLGEEAVIQLYNFMKEHYERTIKDRLMPDFGREKVCYVPYLGLPDDMVDSSYMAFRELMGRVEPQITISQSKYTELQDKVDEFEGMKKERDDYKFKYETWKEDYEDLSEMYDDLYDKYDLEQDKVEMLLNFLKREGYGPEFIYNGTVLKVKRN